MARSHMIYDDKFLESTPSFQVDWKTPWNQSDFCM